jgi:5-methylcytosine-specific restriction endonuclease McrA
VVPDDAAGRASRLERTGRSAANAPVDSTPTDARRAVPFPGPIGKEVDTAVARALLLNASFEPLCVVSSRRAVVLVLKEKAEIVHRNGAEFRSERRSVPVPSVIRLVHFVRVPYRAAAPLSRRAVFARDGHRCQYCGSNAENLDHVVPRSRGGTHTWDNVVASCRSCNSRKEDRLPSECSMSLRHSPRAPHATTSLIASAGPVDPDWGPYLSRIEAVPA